jgi:hypothetical protein
MSLQVTVEHQMRRLGETVDRYQRLTGLTNDEVLEKKGRDLGIQLYRGYRDRRYGGESKLGRTLPLAELRQRSASGRGIRVRAKILERYRSERRFLLRERRALRGVSRPLTQQGQRASDAGLRRNQRARIGAWRRAVGREISARASGMGVLSVSFLWYRRRPGRDGLGRRITVYRRNKSGQPLGYVEKGKDSLRIVGMTEGLDIVDARYGIVTRAIGRTISDMEVYISRKHREALAAAGFTAVAP